MDSESNKEQQDKETQEDSIKHYSLEENKEIGRYYAAGKDLKAGELILLETPICYAPTSKKESALAVDKMRCFGCNGILKGSQFQQCSKCKLFVCSSTCEKMAVHADNECEVFQKLKTTYKPTLRDIFYLRTALLKKSNPIAFEEIKNLAHGLPKAGKAVEMSNDAVKRVLDCFGLEELITVDEWLQIANIVNANKYSSNMLVKTHAKKYNAAWSYLCLEASLFPHSCAPNCILECTPLPKMEVSVRASTAIKKGEVLYVDHFGKTLLVDTCGRHKHHKFFECNCRRCKDPSELGSHLGTLVCPECRAMDMQSTDPIEKSADWECNSCGTVGYCNRNMSLLTQMSHEMLDMDPEKVGAKAMGERIKKLAGTIFHPNHWILVEALLRLTSFLDGIIDSIDSEEYLLYVSSMEQLISITSIVNPGISDQISVFQYNLASAHMVYATKKKRKLRSEASKRKVLKILARATQLLTDATTYLDYYVCTCHSKSQTALDVHKKMELIDELRRKILKALPPA